MITEIMPKKKVTWYHGDDLFQIGVPLGSKTFFQKYNHGAESVTGMLVLYPSQVK